MSAASSVWSGYYTVLVALSEAPDRRLRAYELCDALGWEKSRLHHHFTRMCRRGLVEREQGDARAIHVTLTDTGLEALRSAVPGHAREVRRLVFDRLTEVQVRQLGAISTCLLTEAGGIPLPRRPLGRRPPVTEDRFCHSGLLTRR